MDELKFKELFLSISLNLKEKGTKVKTLLSHFNSARQNPRNLNCIKNQFKTFLFKNHIGRMCFFSQELF